MDYRFREIRDEYELKQNDVADKMRISRGAYANIEAETANIKLKDFLTYCNEMNFTMDYVANLDSLNRMLFVKKIDFKIKIFYLKG